MNDGMTTSFTRRLVGAMALIGAVLVSSGQATAAPVNEIDLAELTPTPVGTAHQHQCPPPVMTTPGIECQGFAGREILADSSLFVVGFENNAELKEKHVYQAVTVFDLAPLRGLPEGAKLAKAALTFGEASTTRRSAGGDSEYGILPTCNTQLGLPAAGWGGGLDLVVPTSPAAVVGAPGVTTGSSGAWDVTPQVEQWLQGAATKGTFVFRGDDETMDVKGQQACLSYISGVGLAVEFTRPQ